ncbi:M48 family metallopeptidase [Chitinibacteraceae bacterium HSL-7]
MELQLERDGRLVRFLVRRSRRRSIGLSLGLNGLVVALPMRAPLSEAERVVALKWSWICRHLDARPPAPQPLGFGTTLTWLGEPRVLMPAGKSGLDAHILAIAADETTLAPRLATFMQRHARVYFAERIAYWSEQMGVSARRVLLTSARSRWGSCSSAGDIRLNWRLMQAPVSVVDYVVIHELAHLSEMNHSERFWAIVARHCPGWAQERAWLKAHGAALYRV